MSPGSELWMRQAQQRLGAARFIFTGGYYGEVVAAGYFAAYAAAHALLQSRGLQAKSHAGTHDQIFRHFVGRGLTRSHSNALRRVGQLRAAYHYDGKDFSAQDAQEVLETVTDFVRQAEVLV